MTRAVWPLCLVALCCGCAGSSQEISHDLPDLTLEETERVRLRTDLPPEQALEILESVTALELAVDSAFPWLATAKVEPLLTLVVSDPARYALYADDHGAEKGSGAFVCPKGELVLRYREEDWSESPPGPPFPLEPRVRPLAAAILRRRLLRHYGSDLEHTWLEEGLVRVFVEIAAVAFGDTHRAARKNRERLLDAFLPLYLGSEPALAQLASARGRTEMKRRSTAAQAWAAVRFLLAKPELTAHLETGLRAAAGDPAVEGPWQQALAALEAQESAFLEFLQTAVTHELLAAFEEAPTAVDRWEAAAALRLIANVDLDPDASDAQRTHLVRGTLEVLAQAPLQRHFLDKYAGELQLVRESRSRLKAMARLRSIVAKELTRRSAGYGHPAVEHARRNLGRALQRALDAE